MYWTKPQVRNMLALIGCRPEESANSKVGWSFERGMLMLNLYTLAPWLGFVFICPEVIGQGISMTLRRLRTVKRSVSTGEHELRRVPS